MSAAQPGVAGTESYLTNAALEAAGQAALGLQKPLLVRGEPGTGKTLLAEAIAEAEGLELITWHIKSTMRAIFNECSASPPSES